MLRRAAAVGLAVELRQAPAGIGVTDRRNAGLVGLLQAAGAKSTIGGIALLIYLVLLRLQ